MQWGQQAIDHAATLGAIKVIDAVFQLQLAAAQHGFERTASPFGQTHQRVGFGAQFLDRSELVGQALRQLLAGVLPQAGHALFECRDFDRTADILEGAQLFRRAGARVVADDLGPTEADIAVAVIVIHARKIDCRSPTVDAAGCPGHALPVQAGMLLALPRQNAGMNIAKQGNQLRTCDAIQARPERAVFISDILDCAVFAFGRFGPARLDEFLISSAVGRRAVDLEAASLVDFDAKCGMVGQVSGFLLFAVHGDDKQRLAIEGLIYSCGG